MTRLRLFVLIALSAMLSACLLMPGKFDSALDVKRDGTFHFHDAGELVFLPLTDAARTQMAKGMQKMQGKQAGATGWIVKPFNPEQLLATIARVL